MMSEVFTNECRIPMPKKAGKGTLRIEKGLYVMHCEGTYDEMGRQNAELARGIVDDYVPRYYGDFLEKIIAHALGGHSGLTTRISALLYSIFASLNRKHLGPNMSGQVKGLVDVFGLSAKKGDELALFADILHFLAGKAMATMYMPGCTGFFARGKATQDGKLVIGRNFDFYGRGVWNTNQCLTVCRPEGTRPYMWIAALGLPVGGFGLSESGIGLMIFTKFCKDVGLSGAPLYTMCCEILEKAENLDEAVAIIARTKRMSANTLLLTDSRARDARAVGFSANHMEVLSPEDDILVRTNHYTTAAMQQFEVAPRVWTRHSVARFNRVTSILKEKFGKLTPADATSILSDVFDIWEGRKRVVGDIVASTNNAISVVVSPDDDAMYVAHGTFPVCGADKYNGFSLKALFSGADSASIADIPGGGQLGADEKLALAHYQEAWTEHLDRFDDAKAIFHLRRAAEILPDEPIFDRVAGILLMKQGRSDGALDHMKKNAEYKYRDERMKSESQLWLGRCLDLCGKHSEAIPCYKLAAESSDAEMSACATKHINSPFTAKQMKPVDIEFIVGSPTVKYV